MKRLSCAREELQQIAQTSKTFAEISKKLGYAYPASQRVKQRLDREEIDYSHVHDGRVYEDRTKENCLAEIFVENSLYPRGSARIYAKRFSLVPYVCECGNEGVWRGKPLLLQLHHKNGNPTDHRIENLAFTCPNCHSQEPTTNRPKRASRPIDSDVVSAFPKCANIRDILTTLEMVDNGMNYRIVKRILKKNGLVFPPISYSMKEEKKREKRRVDLVASGKTGHGVRKVEWPSKERLAEMVWQMSVAKIASEFGVSGSAVEGWCVTYDITSKPPRGYWAKRHAGMTHQEALLPNRPKQARILPKLTDLQVQEILRALSLGDQSLRELGRLFNVNRSTIERIRDGKSYRHIPRDSAPARTPTLNSPVETECDVSFTTGA